MPQAEMIYESLMSDISLQKCYKLHDTKYSSWFISVAYPTEHPRVVWEIWRNNSHRVTNTINCLYRKFYYSSDSLFLKTAIYYLVWNCLFRSQIKAQIRQFIRWKTPVGPRSRNWNKRMEKKQSRKCDLKNKLSLAITVLFHYVTINKKKSENLMIFKMNLFQKRLNFYGLF